MSNPDLEPLLLEASIAYGKFMQFSGLGTDRVVQLALQLAKRLGDDLRSARLSQAFGNVALTRSNHSEARTRYEDALSLFRQFGDIQGEANCIRSLGEIARRRSDHSEARTRYEAALPLYRQVGDIQGEVK